MNLDLIKERLEQVGYYCFINDNILVSGTSIDYDEQTGISAYQNVVGLEIRDSKIVVDYTPAQIPKEKEFTSIEAAVEFIKEVIPLQT